MSPFNLLPYDMLWHIVSLNGNMFRSEDALKTTRHTSQVCHAWRENIINMPDVWAKLVDIDALSISAPMWIQELIRRSASCPLWVSFRSQKICLEDDTVAKVLIPVLREQWGKIQRLVMKRIWLYNNPPDLLSLLCRASPCIEEFDVGILWYWKDELLGNLFDNSAPALRTFRFDEYKVITQQSWTMNLRHLKLGSHFSPLNLKDALNHLQFTSNIQQLGLFLFQCEEGLPAHPAICLPQLKEINLISCLNTCYSFLELVTFPDTCILTYQTDSVRRGDYTRANREKYLGALSNYARRHFKKCVPTRVIAVISQSRLILVDASLQDSFGLSISYRYVGRWIDLSEYDLCILCDSLLYQDIQPVMDVRLDFNQHFDNSAIMSVWSRLSYVHTLQTSEHSTAMLAFACLWAMKTSSTETLASPGLKKLVITPFQPWLEGKSVLYLAKLQHAAGYPLDIIDWTKSRFPQSQLYRYDRLHGLKLRWIQSEDGQPVEYTCGTLREWLPGDGSDLV